ncbi:MAG: hypothetical protein KME06_02250 [Kastovskya adunca ATA6-11-RM4]|jgi:hypothetical protein|nr:hypothetical protein [Kastovskya adunca ATA6-11-RM4]
MSIWKVVASLVLALTTSCDVPERVAFWCNKFPDVASVEKTLSEQAQVVNQIKSVHPGFVDIKVDEAEDCPGKARIEILHATEQDRKKIEQIIGDTFFGVPYRMQNI